MQILLSDTLVQKVSLFLISTNLVNFTCLQQLWKNLFSSLEGLKEVLGSASSPIKPGKASEFPGRLSEWSPASVCRWARGFPVVPSEPGHQVSVTLRMLHIRPPSWGPPSWGRSV